LIVRPELSLRLARENAFDSFIPEIGASIAGAKDWLTTLRAAVSRHETAGRA
jgi:hypothetical protein